MWACQKALHAISGMTALKQSQLVVQTRRGRRSVTVVMVLECGIADPPPPCHQLLNFQDDPSCVPLLKQPRAARSVNKLSAASVPIGRRLLVRTNNHVMTNESSPAVDAGRQLVMSVSYRRLACLKSHTPSPLAAPA